MRPWESSEKPCATPLRTFDTWKHFDPLARELLSQSGLRYSGPGLVLAMEDVPSYVNSLKVGTGNTSMVYLALSWVPLRGRVDITSKKIRGGGPWAVLRYAEDLLIFGGPGLMRRRSEPEGKVRWSCELRGSSRLVGADERTQSLFVESNREGLVCIDAESGAIRWWNHEVDPELAVGGAGPDPRLLRLRAEGGLAGADPHARAEERQGARRRGDSPSHATDRLVLDAEGGLWLEDGTDYLGERLQSGLRLLPSGKLESHVRSCLDQTLVRHVAGVELEVTSSYVRRGDRALSLPLDPETRRPAWVRAGPAWGRRLLMRHHGEHLPQPATQVWHAVELDGLLSSPQSKPRSA